MLRFLVSCDIFAILSGHCQLGKEIESMHKALLFVLFGIFYVSAWAGISHFFSGIDPDLRLKRSRLMFIVSSVLLAASAILWIVAPSHEKIAEVYAQGGSISTGSGFYNFGLFAVFFGAAVLHGLHFVFLNRRANSAWVMVEASPIAVVASYNYQEPRRDRMNKIKSFMRSLGPHIAGELATLGIIAGAVAIYRKVKTSRKYSQKKSGRR